MKKLLCLPFLLLFAEFCFSQRLNDTLFYKSGVERVANITSYDHAFVNYVYINSKGDTLETMTKTSQLKRFVVYDESDQLVFTNEALSKDRLKPNIDSLTMKRHLLSVNPFSVPLLGINTIYTYRFGPQMKLGIHIPVRMVGLLITGGELGGYTGIGLTYFAATNENYSLTLGGTAGFYLFGEETILALPVELGFVRYLTDLWAISGHIGIGPGYSLMSNDLKGFPIPSAHLGITFQLGKPEIIQGY